MKTPNPATSCITCHAAERAPGELLCDYCINPPDLRPEYVQRGAIPSARDIRIAKLSAHNQDDVISCSSERKQL